jgi:hypothetical protein
VMAFRKIKIKIVLWLSFKIFTLIFEVIGVD